MKLPLLPQAVYDFTQLDRQDMLVRVQKEFTQINPDWVDYSPNFPENLLLEGGVTQADIYRFMMEERARQWWLATMTDRLAAIRKGQLHNFTLRGATAPTLTGSFQLPNSAVATKRIDVQPGTRIVSLDASDPSYYRYSGTSTLEIPAGSNSVSADMEGCELQTDEFESSDEPNQVWPLTYAPIIHDSTTDRPAVSVSAGNGDYELVDSFMGEDAAGDAIGPDSLVCAVVVDHDGYGYLKFGDGIYGKLPQGTITVEYKTGGGSVTEVPASTDWSILDQIYDEAGQPVTLEFVNTAASDSADDRMSVGEARVQMPLYIRTNRRSIIDDDYEYAALSVSGVARAKLLTSNHDSSIAESRGNLLVVAKGNELASGRVAAATPSAAKIAEVEAILAGGGAYPAHMGFQVDVIAASFHTIDGAIRIHKALNYTGATVKAALNAVWQNFFAVLYGADDYDAYGNSLNGRPTEHVDFGCNLLGYNGSPNYLISWSAVLDALLSAAGVGRVPPGNDDLTLGGTRSSATLEPAEFPYPGTLTIYDMDEDGVVL